MVSFQGYAYIKARYRRFESSYDLTCDLSNYPEQTGYLSKNVDSLPAFKTVSWLKELRTCLIQDLQQVLDIDDSTECTLSMKARNLGVIFDSTLSVESHVSNVCKCAFMNIRNIKLDNSSMPKLCLCMSKPVLFLILTIVILFFSAFQNTRFSNSKMQNSS